MVSSPGAFRSAKTWDHSAPPTMPKWLAEWLKWLRAYKLLMHHDASNLALSGEPWFTSHCGTDPFLWERLGYLATQYGFRSVKGTWQPLFIWRRFMDWARHTGHSAHMIFLDWQTASDTIDNAALSISLEQNAVCTQPISRSWIPSILNWISV